MIQPRSDSTITPQPPTTAYRPVRAGHGAETVINPERRGAPLSPSDGSGMPNSSVWHRLFPSDHGFVENAEILTPDGLQLGHFQIERRIGAGGMGAVFRATDTRLQRAVALKILSPNLSRDEAAVQRFRNEARSAARLDHDNIARVYFIGEDHGLHFIAFEFITGTNLRELIRERGTIEPAEAVNYVLQIASALRHTSANGVVHRDIKPSNIIITPSGRAKLVDLGLARKESSESAPDLTLAGTTLGTFDYISPEQAKDPRNVDVRSDIYSLGCTLYQMLTGEPPYPEGTVLKKLLDHQSGEPPDPAKKNRRVSEQLSLIVRKMMASDPKRRYQSPDQLIRDLMLIAGSLGLRGVTPEGLIWLSSKQTLADFWRQNTGVVAMVALLTLIVVGLNQFPNVGASRQENSSPAQAAAQAHLDQGQAESVNGSATTALPKNSLTLTNNPDGIEDSGSTPNLAAEANPATSRMDEAFIPPAKLFPELPAEVLDDSFPPPLSTQLERRDNLPVMASTGRNSFDVIKSRTDSVVASEPVSTGPTAATTTDASRAGTAPSEKSPVAAEETTGVFVLGTDGVAPKKFPTLEAACAAVADGNVIELRFNGRRSEKPLRLSKKTLTIRAAKGFHPIVEFSPANETSDSQLRLINITAGPVQISQVAFEVTVPSHISVDRLSLFSVDRPEQLRLQGVAITVSNPGRRPVSVFDLSLEPGQMLSDMKMNTTGMARDPLEFELSECLLRGHGDLFNVRHTKPCRLLLRDCAVALDGCLLRVEGHSEKPAEQTRIELRLDHVTAVLGQNLVRLDCGDVPRELAPVSATARNNILTTLGSSALVAMAGNLNDADFRKLFQWTGEKNFYDRTQVFWTLASGLEVLTFDDWKSIWGANGDVGASNEKLTWLSPRDDLAQVLVKSLTLDHNSVSPNPAVGASADGSDAGANPEKLPLTAATE